MRGGCGGPQTGTNELVGNRANLSIFGTLDISNHPIVSYCIPNSLKNVLFLSSFQRGLYSAIQEPEKCGPDTVRIGSPDPPISRSGLSAVVDSPVSLHRWKFAQKIPNPIPLYRSTFAPIKWLAFKNPRKISINHCMVHDSLFHSFDVLGPG